MTVKISGIIFISIFITLQAYADSLYLKNGNRVSGIITKESKDSVEIEINIGATVTFSKQDIERIERDTEIDHARMKEAWEAERARRKVEKIEEKASREQQRQKGLVEYKGKWVTPEERERLQAANIARDVRKGVDERRFTRRADNVARSSYARKLLKKGDWFVRETEHFSIFYRDPSQGKIVSDKAEYYFEKIVYDLGYENKIKWDRKCQVYIVEDTARWKDFLRDIGFNPEAVGGFVPNYKEREMFLCALSNIYLAVTFPHELTHLIFREIAGNSTIPLWLNEGLANYEASVTSISNDLLRKHIEQGRHILLGDLLRMARYPEGQEMRELFYAQSEKLVEFLITQYGRKKFKDFCELILKDKSFSESLFAVYGKVFKDIEDFNIQLVEYIVK